MVVPGMAGFHHRAAGMFAIAMLAALLGGCFLSEQAKFPLSAAAPALGEGGRFDIFEHEAGDRYKAQAEVLVLKRRPDGAYDFTNEKGESSPISLHRVAPDLFVGQSASTRGDKTAFAYVMFRVAGNEAFLYIPQCEAQDQAKLAAAKVEVRGQLECYIDGVADPAALFASFKLGDPVSKLVRK